ncbi:MAG: hypothetical protein WB462_08185 [Solirubrobacterales bacterium]
MGQIVFDEEMARQVEALYRIRDAALRRGLVREKLAAQPGERVLDVGCGPGFTASSWRRRSGSRAQSSALTAASRC